VGLTWLATWQGWDPRSARRRVLIRRLTPRRSERPNEENGFAQQQQRHDREACFVPAQALPQPFDAVGRMLPRQTPVFTTSWTIGDHSDHNVCR
jgi:hypothetical protein